MAHRVAVAGRAVTPGQLPHFQEEKMRRLILAIAATLGLTASAPLGVAADLSSLTQVILSCNDGHSVILSADQTTLASLTADVQSINTSGTALSCTLDTPAIDPSTGSARWTVYDYNPSGQAIAPRHSPNSMPATTPDTGVTWQFPFKADIYTALFTTTDPSLTGNVFGKTLTDTITLSGDAATFMTQRSGGANCSSNFPAVVRFYFTSPSASGPSYPPPGQPINGLPPAGFYTQFWWSDAVNMQMLRGGLSQTLIESMTPNDWSDWDGQPASEFPLTFMQAAEHVQSIGLSFGGTCFFETGVTPSPDTFTNEQLSSMFSEGT
jgi:hypothetical protein